MGLIQIRDVPAATHRRLKARAAERGKTLSAYLREQLISMAERPTPDEVWARIRARPPVDPSETPADLIRRQRDARG